jgi:hypothetical protein
MKDYCKKVLQASINRMLEDGYKKIKAKHLYTYSKHDIGVVEESIQDWERRGMLKILKPYQDCDPEEDCVELLRFIDQKSPIKDYMNWENE